MNKLFYGDNLDTLRKTHVLPSDSVDLIYIDPPFNSKRSYNQIYNSIGGEDRAQAEAFKDTWEWDDYSVAGYNEILDNAEGRFTSETVELIKALGLILNKAGNKNSLLAYLISMTLRINEMQRILKPTGSFYLHADPTASHYLKLILDSIFLPRGGDFLNEIIWRYQTGGVSKRWFGRKHDVILFYTKSSHYQFYPDRVLVPRTDEVLRRIQSGTPGATRATTMEKLPDDVFDIQALNAMAAERLGYPTQKPEALLERIILASSNEGDVVLDAYCGCGTTVAVAQRLGRQWIGLDITYQSIALILRRLEATFGKEVAEAVELSGVPKDMKSAEALALKKEDRTRKEFEKWALLTYSENRALVNEKKGADGGMDGTAFTRTGADSNAKVVFQVKSGKVGSKDIDALVGVMSKFGAELGVFITLNEATAPMKGAAADAGLWAHPLMGRSYPRVRIVTIREMLEEGARLDLPLPIEVLKKAAAAKASAAQLTLDTSDDAAKLDEA